jgi:mono/diheme cytochrome c family protein
MPGFGGALRDNQIADITNYVRTGLDKSCRGGRNAPLGRQPRPFAGIAVGSEAARSLDFPKGGETQC